MSSNPISPDPFDNFDELFIFRESLTSESDRGCALFACAYLDAQLERLLSSYFVDDADVREDLLGQSKPLATFSSRIDLAYALGLIGRKAQRDLHLLRKIRNDFAHMPVAISFEAEAIANRCRELYHDGLQKADPPRKKFTRVVMGVLAMIHAAVATKIRCHVLPDVDLTPEMVGAFRVETQNVKEALSKLQDDAQIPTQ